MGVYEGKLPFFNAAMADFRGELNSYHLERVLAKRLQDNAPQVGRVIHPGEQLPSSA